MKKNSFQTIDKFNLNQFIYKIKLKPFINFIHIFFVIFVKYNNILINIIFIDIFLKLNYLFLFNNLKIFNKIIKICNEN